MASTNDEEINSLNPLRMPPDRQTARTIFRYGVNGTCAAFVFSALAVSWHNLSRYAATEMTAAQLLLTGLFVLFALWVRQRGTTWPLAILMMFATVSGLASLAYSWTELVAETPKYRIMMSAPDVLAILAQFHNVRALRYLLEYGGTLAIGPTTRDNVAPQAGEEVQWHEPRMEAVSESAAARNPSGPKSSLMWAVAGVTVLIVAALLWYRWPKAEPSPATSAPAVPLEAQQAPADPPQSMVSPAAPSAGWRVNKDSANHSCEMLTTLDTEYGLTFISLNYRVFDERITFAFLAQQVAIPEGTPYISFDFDGNRQEWQQMPATRRSGEGVGTGFTLDLTTDIIDAMNSHRDMIVNVNGQPIFRLDTTEAADALKQLGSCAIDIGTGG